MDSITQGVLGATIGEAILGKKMGHKAAIAGAIIATLPDLDVLLYLVYDKYDMLSIHRGFSHSICFSLIGALLISYILSHTKWFKDITVFSLLLFSWLVLFTHILVDACTSYGTQLLLPFSNQRVGFDSINVVDPIYTLPLLIGLLLSVWVYRSNTNRSRYNQYGLMISSLYLIFTLINKAQVKSAIAQELALQDIEYDALLTMPVGMANIKWYGVAKGQDSIFMLKHSILSGTEKRIEPFSINESYLLDIEEEVADKMRWFAKGFYTVEKENETIRFYNLQVDMRGIVKVGDKKAPTKGYFKLLNVNGQTQLTSGTLKNN